MLCTDTQETVGDQKREAEKLYVSDTYPIAIGAAGIDEALDAFAQELIELVEKQQPDTITALKTAVQAALKELHERDAAASDYPAEYRKTQYLVAAWPNHETKPVLFRIRGKRIFIVKKHAIIGYETAANYALLDRLYRKNLPMQQAVMLGIYLDSQSKKLDALDAYVGGDTRVAVVTGNGAWIDYPEYIKYAEGRIVQFLNLMDNLFLLCVDAAIAPSQFPEVLEAFSKDVTELRQRYLRETAAISLNRTFSDPNYRGEPYGKIFPGALVTVTQDAAVEVSEETEEAKEKQRQMMREARQAVNKPEAAQAFQTFVQEHGTPEYIGEEVITIQGSGSRES